MLDRMRLKTATFIVVIMTTLTPFVALSADYPKEVVAEFCKLDFVGNRLSSATYKNISPLVMYPEEPGWDTVLDIRNHNVADEVVEGDFVKVSVLYEIDRMWPKDTRGKSDFKFETFILKNDGSNLKIAEFIMFPRVSSDVLCTKFDYCTDGSH